MQQQCRLVLPGATCGELIVALPVAGLSALRAAAERHFGAELQGQVRGASRRVAGAQGCRRQRWRRVQGPLTAAACLLPLLVRPGASTLQYCPSLAELACRCRTS